MTQTGFKRLLREYATIYSLSKTLSVSITRLLNILVDSVIVSYAFDRIAHTQTRPMWKITKCCD